MNVPSTQDMHNERQGPYRSYLLRLWCTKPSEPGCWRASLEDSHTGERLGFANLEELFAFLIQQIEANRHQK
jgi:hypothetical protein